MTKKTKDNLKDKTTAELKKMLIDARQEWLKLKLDLKINKLKNLHQPKAKRKEISRILTMLKLKSFQGEK